MIIWSRWGILAFLFVGVGVSIGFLLASVFGAARREGPITGVFIGIGLVIAAVGLFFFDRLVVQRHLDKPRPLTITRPLARPASRTPTVACRPTRSCRPLDGGTGQPIVVRPTSTLFFIPVRFWPFVLAEAIGLVVLVINVVALARGWRAPSVVAAGSRRDRAGDDELADEGHFRDAESRHVAGPGPHRGGARRVVRKVLASTASPIATTAAASVSENSTVRYGLMGSDFPATSKASFGFSRQR